MEGNEQREGKRRAIKVLVILELIAIVGMGTSVLQAGLLPLSSLVWDSAGLTASLVLWVVCGCVYFVVAPLFSGAKASANREHATRGRLWARIIVALALVVAGLGAPFGIQSLVLESVPAPRGIEVQQKRWMEKELGFDLAFVNSSSSGLKVYFIRGTGRKGRVAGLMRDLGEPQ